jgi:trehalose 6-phosphate synthase/phosphatase
LGKGQPPSAKILTTLEYLTFDKRNTIFIVTGREARLVSEWFSCVSSLGLASEHGFLYRFNSDEKHSDKWERMLANFNIEWKGFTVEHLEPYTERCEGSFIEVKEASVVWQYRDCDPELGKSFANVITLDLESTLRNLNLNIINGKGYVEVKPKGINKGAFLSLILKEEIKKGKIPDFILTIGDDTADEEMFKYLKKKKSAIKNFAKNLKSYSITVGKKPSSADCYVDNASDVRNLLEVFMQCSIKKKMSSSTFDVRNIGSLNESTTGDHNSSSSNDRVGLHHLEHNISDL